MKKVVKVLGIIALSFVLFVGIAIIKMGKIANDAVSKQVNEEIDMSQVQDGIYQGESDGGMVKVCVEVEVKDHKLQSIQILKHENGKGKPAEAMIEDMLKENTDDVDIVSGATTSSKTIRNAVNVALQKGIDRVQ